MPVQGLSLVGFFDEAQAIGYLRERCVVPDPSDAALKAAHEEARGRLGGPVGNAGRPEVLDIPPDHADHLRGVIRSNPRYEATVMGMKSASFKLVELAPLLAYQFHVATDRTDDLCASIGAPPRLEELLPICLPHTLEIAPSQLAQLPNSLCFKTPSLNLRILGAGQLGIDPAQHFIAGIAFGPSSNLVQVIQFEGRTYLRNGFHRAFGLARSGATHIPCVFLEAADFAQVGVQGGSLTFGRELLASDNPPTLAHLTPDRAYAVALRTITKIITVSWSEYAFLES
jgi:hypothetical protein